jgi:hypothetical protein
MLVALGVLLVGTGARAESHQVCLDLELGPQLFDASPRQPSGATCGGQAPGTPCDPGSGLTPWEECDGAGACVPTEPDFGEDHGRWEGDRPFTAMRWLARARDASSNEVMWGWAPLDDDGCTGTFDDSELPAPITQVTLDWMRWSVSPQGHSILGYECDLSDSDPSMVQGVDGACKDLRPGSVTLEAGEISGACGGGESSADHCTIYTKTENELDPIEYNLWAMTFADSRIDFAEPTQAYVLQETDYENNHGTSAGPHMGRHPCVRLKWNQWRSKFLAVHEYGHLVFFDIPNTQGDHPTVYLPPPGDIDYGMGGQHSATSPEWQAVAAVEGLANLAALAAWNDLAEDDVVRLVRVFESGGGGAVPTFYEHPADGPVACTPGCGDGQANEWNWGGALRQFLRAPSPLSTLEIVAGMVPEVHGSMWYPNGADNAFGNEFDATMSVWLSNALHAKWSGLVEAHDLYEVDP